MKLAFKSLGRNKSLWRAEAVREMCEMDERLVLNSPYIKKFNGEVCPSHSIGYYIGLLSKKECKDITDDDMKMVSEVSYQNSFVTDLKILQKAPLSK